jgi:hypothetical protein
VRKALLCLALLTIALGFVATSQLKAQVNLLAVGSLTSSSAGSYADLSGLHDTLENGAPANLLGGLGSGLAYASGNTFLALPDRGPNAVSYDSFVDDTVTYIPRYHTITMDLTPNSGAGLPFRLTPELRNTTLLFSLIPLVYGTGENLAVGSGVPPQNNFLLHYFTGRSDALTPTAIPATPTMAAWTPKVSGFPTTAFGFTSPTSTARTSMNLTGSLACACAPSNSPRTFSSPS